MASRLVAGSPTPAPEAPAQVSVREPAAQELPAQELPSQELPSQGPPAQELLSPNGGLGLQAGRDAPLGGQAVLEGVMMRGIRNWAVAVRKPAASPEGDSTAGSDAAASDAAASAMVASADDASVEPAALGEIEVTSYPLRSVLRRHRVLRLPILRGVIALGESLGIGFKALGISANAQLAAADEGEEGEEPMEISGGIWAGTIVVALVFAIGLFFLLPLGLTSLIKHQLNSSVLFWVVEGLLRTAIFLGYMVLLSRLRDLRRVFEYHGAEHKTISCFEAGLPLEPINAQRFSRLHPRCGTSFLLIVMVVSIFVFGAVGLPAWYWLVASRILGVPIIAGISFEIIKFAGRNRRRRWVRVVMWPGMQLQLLTTREPDLDQLAVAIAALEAVLTLEKPGEMTAKDLVGVEVVA
jgi:uncharacterized protein YqhQ